MESQESAEREFDGGEWHFCPVSLPLMQLRESAKARRLAQGAVARVCAGWDMERATQALQMERAECQRRGMKHFAEALAKAKELWRAFKELASSASIGRSK